MRYDTVADHTRLQGTPAATLASRGMTSSHAREHRGETHVLGVRVPEYEYPDSSN
jgi:hypothetical protein